LAGFEVTIEERPGIIIKRDQHREVFDRLVRLFDLVWENAARRPTKEECIV
jgi:hypothetical protein